jgi:hypothetical protein
MEVLRDAKQHGVSMEKSIWAEFLLWHQQHMTSHFPHEGEISVGYKNREREENDE